MFYLLLIFSSLLCRNSFAGGWVGSGGDGMLCFEDSKEGRQYAQQVRDSYKENSLLTKQLKNKLLPHVKELVTLEFWEERETLWKDLDTTDKNVNPNLPYEMKIFQPVNSYDDALKKVHSQISQYAPAFLEVLKWAETKVSISTLKSEASLPDVSDSTPIVQDYAKRFPSCALVQLALRKTYGESENAQIETYIDSDLFNLLKDDLNKAMLILHEQAYTIAFYFGHRSSDRIRQFVRYVFTTQYWLDSVMNPSLVDASNDFQNFINYAIGNYYALFFKVTPKEKQGPYFADFQTLWMKENMFYRKCMKENVDPNIASTEELLSWSQRCALESRYFLNLHPNTPKEALLFLMRPPLNSKARLIRYGELMTPTFEQILVQPTITNEPFERADNQTMFKLYCDEIQISYDHNLKNRVINQENNQEREFWLGLKKLFDLALEQCSKERTATN